MGSVEVVEVMAVLCRTVSIKGHLLF